MSRTPRPRGGARRGARRTAVRGPSERWLRELVASSEAARRFFDPDWYLVRHPDLLSAGAEPFAHYAQHGAREGRDPSPLVSARWYADRVPAVASGATSLLEHLVAHGEPEGLATSPFVDLAWYQRHHADVEASGRAPLEHLWTIGLAEVRDPSPYVDLAHYARTHPDVARSGMDPLTHFVTVGHALGWWAHPLWREEDHVLTNPYVRFALTMGKARSGYEHFCGIGADQAARGEVVVSYVLDGRVHEHVEARYLAEHVDVAHAVAQGRHRHGVEHLFSLGHRELAEGVRAHHVEGPPRASARHPGGRAASGGAPELVVLLAHHDRDGIVDAHVERAIATLGSAGADVHLITTGLTEAAVEAVRPLVASITFKAENASTLDFGSWSLAAELLGDAVLSRPRWVVLANDSSYFPVRDPAPMLEHLEASTADVWAATDSLSWDRHHLQSYFLALAPAARRVVLPAIAERLRGHSGLSKAGLVQRFEVGLTRDALAAGLSLDVFRSVRDVLSEGARVDLARHRPDHPSAAVITNLTHHLWRGMLREHGLPFLKVELLRDNPLEVDVEGWQGELDPDWAGVIERHLARIGRSTP